KVEVLTEAGQLTVVEKPNYITVLDAPPSVDFTASPVKGEAPLLVKFKATNIGGPVATYQWNFGDGASLVSVIVDSVAHTYTAPGDFTVSLTATGPGGLSTKTIAKLISVLPPPTPVVAGDFNGDSKVDFADFFIFSTLFGRKRGDANFDERIDLVPDGLIDLADFFKFAEKFGK
ncbi:MAG: PKD domain-containing protein, partial [Patescibacteria group bacterium]